MENNQEVKNTGAIAPKKRKSIGKIIVPISIVIILAAFAGLIYYMKVVKPAKEVDKMAGYDVDNYIELGKYDDFKYVITQKKWDDLLEEKTYSSEEVNRAAKKGDEVDFKSTAYIKGQKVDDLSSDSTGVEIGNSDSKLYSKLSKALVGLKKGDTASVKVSGKLVSEASKDKKTYSGVVKYDLKVIAVSEVKHAKVTDEWVKNESDEDVDNVKDFYAAMELTLDEDAKADLWQRAVDNATMSSWPPELYQSVKDEAEADARYTAEEWDMTLDEWYAMNGDNEETLKREYLNEVKSTLVMWEIVKKEHLTATDKEIESRYNELFEELKSDGTVKTMDEVKKDYTDKEIREAVLLDKAQNYVYDNSTVVKSYKVPTK